MRIFQFGLPVIALVLSVAASAFDNGKEAPSDRKDGLLQVWQYQPVNANGPSDPLNYVKLEDAEETFDCNGGSLVCQIEAAEDMSTHRPIIQQGDDPSVQTSTYNTTFRTN